MISNHMLPFISVALREIIRKVYYTSNQHLLSLLPLGYDSALIQDIFGNNIILVGDEFVEEVIDALSDEGILTEQYHLHGVN